MVVDDNDDEDHAGGPAVGYSINLDVGGMDAILGSLYRNERGLLGANNNRPSSFASRSGYRPRRRATMSSPADDDKDDEEEEEEGETNDYRPPLAKDGGHRRPRRRRCTVGDDCHDVGRSRVPPTNPNGNAALGTFRRGNNNNNDDGDDDAPLSSTSKRVSWSEMHSVSLIDQLTSPGDVGRAIMAWSDRLPRPPLDLGPDEQRRGGGGGGGDASPATVTAGATAGEVEQQRSERFERPPSRAQQSSRGAAAYRHRQRARMMKQPASSASPPTPSSSSRKKPIRVISLPWTDDRGVEGLYTGEVDAAIRPHGTGTFSTTDDDDNPCVVHSSRTWRDGRLVSAKIPTEYNAKDRDSPTDSKLRKGAAMQEHPSSLRRKSTTKQHSHSASPRPEERDRTRSPPAAPAAIAESRPPVSNANPNEDADDAILPEHDSPSSRDEVSSTSFPGYRLGDAARRRSHMVVLRRNNNNDDDDGSDSDPSSSDVGIANADRLRPLDFAFVLRGNGEWTYGIVADRRLAGDGQPSIRFVLDGGGSTKTIRRKYWGRGIRMVNAVAAAAEEAVEGEEDGGGGARGSGGVIRRPGFPDPVSKSESNARDLMTSGGNDWKETKPPRGKLSRRRPASAVARRGPAHMSINSGRSDAAVTGVGGGFVATRTTTTNPPCPRMSINSGRSDGAVTGVGGFDAAEGGEREGEESPAGNLASMMSLDYLGTLDDWQEEDGEEQEEGEEWRGRRRRGGSSIRYRDSNGDSSSSGDGGTPRGGHSSEGSSGGDSSSSDDGTFRSGYSSDGSAGYSDDEEFEKSNPSHNGSFHQSVNTVSWNDDDDDDDVDEMWNDYDNDNDNDRRIAPKKRISVKNSSSRAADINGRDETRASRRRSTGSVEFREKPSSSATGSKHGARSEKRTSCASSDASPGSDMSSFEGLLRELYVMDSYAT